MRKHIGVLLAFVIVVALTSLCGCAKENEQPAASASPQAVSVAGETQSSAPDTPQDTADATASVAAGEVVITFDYEKQSGTASNQFAVWIEDSGGGFIKTLYATRFTANGGYKNRPDSIPTWVEIAGLAEMTKAEADAITGATPKAGTLSYTWDLTDANGDAVQPGRYMFFVEGSLRWKNRVLYSGTIEVGDASATVQADAQFFYEANGNQPALSDDSPESAMIGAVTASFVPADKNKEDSDMAMLLYQGHGSLRITTKEGKVVYIDPYAGEGYDVPADLILVTHPHQDHTAIDKIKTQNPGCQTITYKEALVNGEHKTFELGFVTVEAVQAGNNPNHDIKECVGYILTLSDGKTIYASGDTSTTDQMATLAERNLDYVFLCCDGRYNMDIAEAVACANLVGAKHSIPYHMAPGELFSEERAEQFNAENRMIVPAGEAFAIE